MWQIYLAYHNLNILLYLPFVYESFLKLFFETKIKYYTMYIEHIRTELAKGYRSTGDISEENIGQSKSTYTFTTA